MTQYTAQEALDKRQKKAKGETKDGKYAGQEQSDLEVCVCLVVCSHGAFQSSVTSPPFRRSPFDQT
jgi:hypothetical protein